MSGYGGNKDSNEGGKVVWSSIDQLSNHLINNFHTPIDRLSIDIGAGGGLNNYSVYVRLIYRLWSYVKPLLSKKTTKEAKHLLEETEKEVNELIRTNVEFQEARAKGLNQIKIKELQNNFVKEADDAIEKIYQAETMIQLFVPFTENEDDGLTDEELWTGISELEFKGERSKENGDKEN